MEEEIMEQPPDTAALSARLAAAEAEIRLYRLAPSLGVSPGAVPYLARLCPDPGGDDDAVKASLEKLLADLPGLRETSRRPGFRVGAGVPQRRDADDALLRAAFGID